MLLRLVACRHVLSQMCATVEHTRPRSIKYQDRDLNRSFREPGQTERFVCLSLILVALSIRLCVTIPQMGSELLGQQMLWIATF